MGVNFPQIGEETWEQLLVEDEQYSYDQAEAASNSFTESPYVDNSIEISSGVDGDHWHLFFYLAIYSADYSTTPIS